MNQWAPEDVKINFIWIFSLVTKWYQYWQWLQLFEFGIYWHVLHSCESSFESPKRINTGNHCSWIYFWFFWDVLYWCESWVWLANGVNTCNYCNNLQLHVNHHSCRKRELILALNEFQNLLGCIGFMWILFIFAKWN